jgi:hypothetical protein
MHHSIGPVAEAHHCSQWRQSGMRARRRD